MTPAQFKQSLSQSKPPAHLTPALAAMWWAAKDDWDRAHKIVMDETGADCAWVHAYLHRVEADLDNAAYWYKCAKKPVATGAIQSEWVSIAEQLLAEITQQ